MGWWLVLNMYKWIIMYTIILPFKCFISSSLLPPVELVRLCFSLHNFTLEKKNKLAYRINEHCWTRIQFNFGADPAHPLGLLGTSTPLKPNLNSSDSPQRLGESLDAGVSVRVTCPAASRPRVFTSAFSMNPEQTQTRKHRGTFFWASLSQIFT